MNEIRIEETRDGVCTVLIGHQVVVAGLTRSEADKLADAFRRRAKKPEITRTGRAF